MRGPGESSAFRAGEHAGTGFGRALSLVPPPYSGAAFRAIEVGVTGAVPSRTYFFEVFFAVVFFLVDLAVDFRDVFLELLTFVAFPLALPAVASRFSFLI